MGVHDPDGAQLFSDSHADWTKGYDATFDPTGDAIVVGWKLTGGRMDFVARKYAF